MALFFAKKRKNFLFLFRKRKEKERKKKKMKKIISIPVNSTITNMPYYSDSRVPVYDGTRATQLVIIDLFALYYSLLSLIYFLHHLYNIGSWTKWSVLQFYGLDRSPQKSGLPLHVNDDSAHTGHNRSHRVQLSRRHISDRGGRHRPMRPHRSHFARLVRHFLLVRLQNVPENTQTVRAEA